MLLEGRTPAWQHLLRHGAATAMLEDPDDVVASATSSAIAAAARRCTALFETKRRENAAKLRIAPEAWQ